jgi:heme/copper-type cytochrome/quinol oxidase subunit 1
MPAPRRRAPAWLLLVAGVVGAALAGVGTWLLARPGPGWFAYAPVSGSTYQPSRAGGLPVALLVLGLVLLGASVAGGVVRRRRGAGER